MTSTNSYPFATRKQILARLEREPDFVLQALLILDGRQTDDERAELDTKYRNRRGWMSSHAVWGTRLASKAAAGEALTDEELGRAAAMTARYGRQLAAHFRAEAVARDPGLAERGRVFGV